MESGYQRHGAGTGNPRARIEYSSSAAQTSTGGRHQSRNDSETSNNNSARSIPRRAIDHDSHESFRGQQLRADGSDSGAEENNPNQRRHYDISSRHIQSSSVSGRGRPNEINEDGPNLNARHEQRSGVRHSESPRRRHQRPELPSDRSSQAARGQGGQNDRHNASGRTPAQRNPQPPPSAYSRRANTRPTAATMEDSDSASADSEGSGNILMLPSTRRDSINSLKELARNNFEQSALIITERTNSQNERVPLHTEVLALVDSGCDLDLVHKAALKRAGIKQKDIQNIGESMWFAGIGGKKSSVRQRVQLRWGKAKDHGELSERRCFYIVDDLPDKLEMVLGQKYLLAAIEKHSK